MIRVKMLPHLDKLGNEVSGIATVIRNYFKYLPQFGVELVAPDATDYDLLAVHAGMTGGDCDVAHLHGLYWSADYTAPQWEYESNARIVEALRYARRVTVPSEWTAEAIRRDMRFNPAVIGHGVEWEEWQHDLPLEGHIIGYAKNRAKLDVCDPDFLTRLARRFPDEIFVSTFAPSGTVPPNIEATGLLEPEVMKRYVQTAACYISTTKETFALGVLEAMAAGVPVLTTNLGNAPNLVQHGVAGYCYQDGDTADLERGLRYCLENRATLGANGRELARQHTWQEACRKIASLYGEAFQEKVARTAVDVVIPVYNKSTEELKRAIDSVLSQTYPAKSVVVVDDGSEESRAAGYLQLVAGYSGRVTLQRQSNAGVAIARNAGIAAGDSTFVACLDADDEIAPTFLETCVAELEADRSLGIAYTYLRWISPDGTTGLGGLNAAGTRGSPWPHAWEFDRHLMKQNQVPTCCVFRREMWKRLGGYRQRYAPDGAGAEDGEFWLRAGAYGWAAKQATTEPLFLYHTGGTVGGNPNYREVDWLSWHPWIKDGQHPFASYATPKNKSHPVRQYDQPVVSVVIPVGNPQHASLLMNALDSLEAQTFRKWEAIVVWDYNTWDVTEDGKGIKPKSEVQFIYDAYPYVKNLTEIGVAASDDYHTGTGRARNLGVQVARASFLLFLDADDSLHPDCLQKMLDAFGETGAMVYSDYMGLATVADPGQLAKDLQANLVAYHPKKQEALIRYQAADYDCAKAHLQPENPPFIWNNITTLMPRKWFVEAGGFDESMKSWEDVDLWYRLSWTGKCFHRIKEPLMVYRFHTGTRRDVGLADWDNLLAYLRQKKARIEHIMCDCNKPKNTPLVPQNGSVQESRATAGLADTDLVMIEYLHPNRGSHAVYGGGSPRRSYGYRKHGDRFYVQRADLKLYPQWFRVLTLASPPVQEVQAPPPPEPLVEDLTQTVYPPKPQPIQPAADSLGRSSGDSLNRQADLAAPSRIQERAITSARLDLQTLPGVTPAVANAMRRAGIRTAEDILKRGVEGLLQIQWIGPQKAPIIFEHVKERYGKPATTPVGTPSSIEPGHLATGQDVVQS